MPSPVGSLPAHDVTVVRVEEKPVGLGNFRGLEVWNGMAAVALKGGRLLTAVRFQLWAANPADVGSLADTLHADLLVAKDDLWIAGFLKMKALAATSPEPVPANGWRKTLDYEFLYEYHYEDSDGAESLIARIPIHSDPEVVDSPDRETNVVTDAMVRWDEQDAPMLNLSGQTGIRLLTMLSFVPGTVPTAPVDLVRTFAGAANPPTVYPSLEDFFTAVTHPTNPDRNAQFIFATFTDFLNAFTAVRSPISLGDWDEDSLPDDYEVTQLEWEQPIQLTEGTDRLQIIYDPGSTEPQFDQTAVVYLRVGQ